MSRFARMLNSGVNCSLFASLISSFSTAHELRNEIVGDNDEAEKYAS